MPGPARPELAEQFAQRALWFDDSPAAALSLADAHAEQGHVEAAREAQRVAITRIRTPEDRMAVRVNEISLMTFSDRRPDRALRAIEAARSELPERFHGELDSVRALISIFATQPVEALADAERVLALSPRAPGSAPEPMAMARHCSTRRNGISRSAWCGPRRNSANSRRPR